MRIDSPGLCGSDLVRAGTSSGDNHYQDEISAVTLRNPRSDVRALYAAMTAANHHEIYHSVPKDMQSDLWTIHLTRALVENPNLSAEQRAVILQGIGLVATGALEIDREDPQWEHLVHEPVQALEREAKVLFERPVARAFLTQLYSTISLSIEGTPSPIIPNCTCSTESDWCCPTPTCIGECTSGRLICTPQQGCCGTFFRYDCDGECL